MVGSGCWWWEVGGREWGEGRGKRGEKIERYIYLLGLQVRRRKDEEGDISQLP